MSFLGDVTKGGFTMWDLDGSGRAIDGGFIRYADVDEETALAASRHVNVAENDRLTFDEIELAGRRIIEVTDPEVMDEGRGFICPWSRASGRRSGAGVSPHAGR